MADARTQTIGKSEPKPQAIGKTGGSAREERKERRSRGARRRGEKRYSCLRRISPPRNYQCERSQAEVKS